jgi:hypothetical protein
VRALARHHHPVDTSPAAKPSTDVSREGRPAKRSARRTVVELCRHSNATYVERTNIMKRRHLVQALLVASLGTFAASGYAQTNTTTDQTPGSPGAAAPAAGTGTTGGTTGTTTNTMGAGAYGTTQTGTMQPMSVDRIRAYEHARANCEAGPAAQRSECQSALSKDYADIPGPCQKLTGNALDACVHGDYPANAGMPVKPAR